MKFKLKYICLAVVSLIVRSVFCFCCLFWAGWGIGAIAANIDVDPITTQAQSQSPSLLYLAVNEQGDRLVFHLADDALMLEVWGNDDSYYSESRDIRDDVPIKSILIAVCGRQAAAMVERGEEATGYTWVIHSLYRFPCKDASQGLSIDGLD